MIRQQRLRVTHDAIIALGANLGDREATLRAAVNELDAVSGLTVRSASRLIETPALKPEGVDVDAPAYLNAVVRVTTALAPRDLLTVLHEIEHAHGRVRDVRWGDRTLDLDIVSFGALRVSEEGLVVPHPRAWQRAFVLAPWLEVQPDARIPGHGAIADLLVATGEQPTVYPAAPLWPAPGRDPSEDDP